MHRSSLGLHDRLARVAVIGATVAWCGASASTALACGGGFGGNIEIEPQQSVAVGFRDGIETYVFAPKFCGAAADFGLVLPIAGALDGEPELLAGDLFGKLDSITAPTIMKSTVCRPDSDSKGVPPGAGGAEDEVDIEVVHSGTVDIFDWVELAAEDSSALTAWLDENEFVYDNKAKAAFDDYIEQGFRFVAFKVSPGASSSDDSPCGTFGPVSVRFATKKPVVPLRIAVAHSDATWREFAWNVFIVAEQPMRADSQSGPSADLQADLRYSGDVAAGDLEQSAALKALARKGERLTRLRVDFNARVDDLWLVPSKDSADFRAETEEIEYVDCAGCSASGEGDTRAASSCVTALMLGLLLRARSRSRRSQGA